MSHSNFSPIHITKTFLPPQKEYNEYVTKIWKADKLTNQGPLLKEFEKRTRKALDVDNFHFVANGTIALQLAMRALDITEGEVITTPFSYVATTSAILWEHCKPVFVDIDSDTLCIDADKIEAAITPKTKVIMPVHVFGNPCDVEKIDAIAKRHNLKVIYDGAHAFGVKYKNKSLLSYGDISTCSFHATKLFHTIEGGCVITKDKKISDKIDLIKRFGHNGDQHHALGINAKASEFHAAMGLCNLNYIDEIIKKREIITGKYNKLLSDKVKRPKLPSGTISNYAYFPVLFESEKQREKVKQSLEHEDIFPRRYFYPSLNTLPYLEDIQNCPLSEDAASKILCLPLYSELSLEGVDRICSIIRQACDT